MYKDIVDEVRRLISERLEDVDCKSVAENKGYSMKQMNRIFMSRTHMNIGEYIHNRKMAQAVMDLRYTKLPIIEIAQKNGFSTQESFTGAFKRDFCVTPNIFRKQHIWEKEEMKQLLLEVVEETSHEIARRDRIELPKPQVSFNFKPSTLWYSIRRNKEDMFPHNFYVECKRSNLYEKLYHRCGNNPVGGAYLTHIYQGEKFTTLTLGFEIPYTEKYPIYEELETTIMPASEYLVVNVPPYKSYELGNHVLAAWDVFTNFAYKTYQLKRNLDSAPIYEWDSISDGYTLYFPICKQEEKDET